MPEAQNTLGFFIKMAASCLLYTKKAEYCLLCFMKFSVLSFLVILPAAVVLLSTMVAAQDDLDGVKAYLNGDYTAALSSFRTQAEQGHAFAQFGLGLAYEEGKGVPKDFFTAAKWYRLAAEQSHRSAQWRLGRMYARGRGVEKDNLEALKYWRLAAEQGHLEAQLKLAYILTDPVPMGFYETNEAEGAQWFRRAALQGDAWASERLGYLYRTGTGVLQNYSKARKWYAQAARLGYSGGQKELALMYLKGLGVQKDNISAHMWFNLAALNGDQNSARYRYDTANKMTSTEINEAQALAMKCLESGYLDCER